MSHLVDVNLDLQNLHKWFDHLTLFRKIHFLMNFLQWRKCILLSNYHNLLYFQNCSSANSQPSASSFKSFSWSLKQFFLTVGQNNFGKKIPFLVNVKWILSGQAFKRKPIFNLVSGTTDSKTQKQIQLLFCDGVSLYSWVHAVHNDGFPQNIFGRNVLGISSGDLLIWRNFKFEVLLTNIWVR